MKSQPDSGHCEACKFAGAAQDTDHLRVCRREPPTLVAMIGRWPVVQAKDWCGEFQSADE